jgi:hypothetical protein
MLVQHFQETQSNNNSIGFLDFLVMHYITDDVNSKDNEQDNQLPFKSTENYLSNGFPVGIANAREIHFSNGCFTINRQYIFPVKALFTNPHHQHTIWHPPKST